MKKQLFAGVAVAGLALAGCANVPEASQTPSAVPTEPATAPTTPVDPVDDYEPPTPSYSCAEAEDDVTDMAMEQHTSGPLLIAFGKTKEVSADGNWLLKCTGKALYSGGNDLSGTVFGYRKKSGNVLVSYLPYG